MPQRRPSNPNGAFGLPPGNARRGGEAGAADAETALAHARADRAGPMRPRWFAGIAPAVAVGGGAVLGANARYLVGIAAERWWGSTFPWGTLLVNVAGSLALGVYLTLATERFASRATTRLFVATGFLGSFTTLSAFGVETVRLVERGQPLPALAYAGATLVAGLLAVVAGIGLARAVPIPPARAASHPGPCADERPRR